MLIFYQENVTLAILGRILQGFGVIPSIGKNKKACTTAAVKFSARHTHIFFSMGGGCPYMSSFLSTRAD